MNQIKGLWRSRWAAVGAAVAVTLAGGGLIRGAQATVTSGSRPVFIAITPCRLFDTRPVPDNVGPRTAPLAAGDTFTAQVTGTNGNCTVAAGAIGIAMNVTIDNPTAASFLTVFPADVARPLSSNLNWTASSSPTPNQVTVLLSALGAVKFYNNAGSVNVIADVVGYYEDHNFDDRYYTKQQIDAFEATPFKERRLSQGIATTLLPHECAFIFAYGVGANPAAGGIVTGYILDSANANVPSVSNDTAFKPGTIFRTSQGGTIGYVEVCSLSDSPKALPAGWQLITAIQTT